MKRYYKNNKLVIRPKQVFHKGKTYINPKDELLQELGYEIKEEQVETPITTISESEKYIKLGEHILEQKKDNGVIKQVLSIAKQKINESKINQEKRDKFKKIIDAKLNKIQ